MELTNYDIGYNNDLVDLYFNDGSSLRVFFDSDTGNIYKRPKIGSFYNVDHKGLYIGYTADGEKIMVHNHYLPGRAVLVTWDGFTQNQVTSLDQKVCSNHPITMVQIVLDKIISREPYDVLNNSCQTLVNEACTNERKNDDVGKVIVGALATVAVVALAASLFGSGNRK